MSAQGLSPESLGYLNYLHSILAQPLGSWEGFYQPLSPSMNFALRYQLAFGAYAVAALAQQTPAYRAPYVEALRGAIDKMLDVAAWGYWRAPSVADEPTSALTGSGHVAVLLSPHRRGPAGPPSDPIVRDNLQYSGHLGTMLGLYEKLSGDDRYDRPFTLHDPESGVSYTYTHGEVAGRIHAQMIENPFGGVCCESGMAYVSCNNHALASNALHDAVHGTGYSLANARWLEWVGKRMVLRGPAVRGVFGTAYMKDFHVTTPVAFNFTDAWGLALMRPFAGDMVRKQYRRFRRKISRPDSGGAYLDSSPVSEKMEISDVPINTGFALIAARGVGDKAMARALQGYATDTFGGGWDGSRYFMKGAPRTLHATALYALASAVAPGGEDLVRLFNSPPDARSWQQPCIDAVAPGDGSLGVSQARYEPSEKALYLSVRRVGDPASLKDALPVDATLRLANIRTSPHVTVNGALFDLRADSLSEDGTLELSVPITGPEGTALVLRF